MLTRKGAFDILRRVMESGGLTDDMEKDIGRLRDDFDEREGILRKYGEVYDGEDRDEYDYVEREREITEPSGEDGRDWKSEYESLHKRYMNRFFGVKPDDTTNTENLVEEVETEPEPAKVQTVEDILMYKEEV